MLNEFYNGSYDPSMDKFDAQALTRWENGVKNKVSELISSGKAVGLMIGGTCRAFAPFEEHMRPAYAEAAKTIDETTCGLVAWAREQGVLTACWACGAAGPRAGLLSRLRREGLPEQQVGTRLLGHRLLLHARGESARSCV